MPLTFDAILTKNRQSTLPHLFLGGPPDIVNTLSADASITHLLRTV